MFLCSNMPLLIHYYFVTLATVCLSVCPSGSVTQKLQHVFASEFLILNAAIKKMFSLLNDFGTVAYIKTNLNPGQGIHYVNNSQVNITMFLYEMVALFCIASMI